MFVRICFVGVGVMAIWVLTVDEYMQVIDKGKKTEQ